VRLYFEEDTTIDDLIKHEASWHKSCHLKFNKCSLERAQKKRDLQDAGPSNEGPEGKRRRDRLSRTKNICLFCTGSDGDLHECMTLEADKNIREMATDLQDTAILARIAGGDIVAIDGMYHLNCLTEFRNRHRSFKRRIRNVDESKMEEKKIKARAFIELVNFVENSVEEDVFCFKLSELRHMYADRLKGLGVQMEVNKCRFKAKVLGYFPQAQVLNDGKNGMLIFFTKA